MGIYLYLERAGRFGWVGGVGFAICALVFALIASLDIGIILDEGVERLYEDLGALRALLLFLGLVLFGVGILRAGTLPRGGAWLLIAAPMANVAGIVGMILTNGTIGGWVWLIPELCIGLGWAWLGYGLWSAGRARA